MQEKALYCKNPLIQYMMEYLGEEINSEEYYELSERCYSMYGDLLKRYYPCFNKLFIEVVPNACLYYIDEPGIDEFTKEELFRKEISAAYSELINL